MKKRNLWFAVLNLIISICACFCLAACNGCSSCDEHSVTAPVELTVPVVTIDYDGVASWEPVENAVGYTYRIDGTDKATERTAVQLSDGQSIRVKAEGDGAKYTDSAWSKVEVFIKTYALDTPSVTIAEDGTASWAEIEHATKYTVKIGENETDTTELSKKLSNGQSVQVKAVGDGALYRDGEYSAVKTYNKLSAPQISVNGDGLASWGEVANATGYIYKINDETTEHSAEELSYQLSNGHKISVKATGAEGWFDSDWATATYIDATKLIKLATPEVTVEEIVAGTSGIAIWKAVDNATGYAYRINGDEEQKVSSSVLSCGLKANDTVTVKALGDGVIYADSEWAAAAKYEVEGNIPVMLSAPAVTIDKEGVARWSAVAGADKYGIEIDGKYDGETVNLYKQLTDGQVIRVKAVDEKGNESAFSKPVKYEAPVSDEVTVNGVKFDFDFIDKADSNTYSLTDANADFKTACGNSNGFGEVISLGYIFKGNGSETGFLKFSSGSNDGYITLNFKKEVVRLVISCKKYENGKLKVNDGTARTTPSTLQDLIFDLATPALKIKIEAEKRCLVYSITAYFRLPDYLEKPEVNIDEYGVATWEKDENASGYIYTVNGGAAQVAGESEVQLTDGDRIIVTAVGDGVNFLSSVSDEKTYNGKKFDSVAERYALAVATLQGMEELKFGAEHKEDFTLPLLLYGVNVLWDVKSSSDTAFVFDEETGKVTVTAPLAEEGDAIVELTADLYYGDINDEDCDIYEPAEGELTFDIIVPAIVKQQLDAPKVNIDPNTGIASWKEVEHADFYAYNVYSNYGYLLYDDLIESGDELAVKLEIDYAITVQACSYNENLYDDSQVTDKKYYNYYPETVDPTGTPLTFDFTVLTQKGQLANPNYIFGLACGNSGCFTSATAEKVELGNEDNNAAITGAGFIKVGSADVSGKITLKFSKKINGVKIKCRTWNSKNVNDKVQVNGSDLQNAGKNGWAELTFNFSAAKASDTVEIVTKNRIFISQIIVYVAD